jgi:hypothetical protein
MRPESPDADFEAFLRSVPPEVPDPVRRELVRQRFLEHASRLADPSRRAPTMDSGDPRAPNDADLERWLRERGPLEVPRAEFRERARRRFLSEALTGPEAVRPVGSPAAAGPWRRWGGLLLAAAAVVVVTILLPEPVRWKARMDGPLSFAGGTYGASDAGRLGVELEQAGLLESQADEVDLLLGGTLQLLVRGHSQVELPPLPLLDGVTPIDLGLRGGEVYVRTHPGYPGNPILVSTPEASIEVLGTTLGILAASEGTCVCVAEGRVEVTSGLLEGGVEAVSRGGSLFLYRDPARPPAATAFADLPDQGGAHVADLVGFHGH